MRKLALATALAVFASVQTVTAGDLIPVELGPMTHADATLTIIGVDGSETVYTPADLERFDTYSLTTVTPWRDEPATFEGVLLRDVLAANGLDQVSAIQVTAENDYATSMDRELLDSVDILLATRVDGRPHTRRARGPIQFVIDNDVYTSSELTSESNFVWMAARIEAAG